jgi:hypothetical protein
MRVRSRKFPEGPPESALSDPIHLGGLRGGSVAIGAAQHLLMRRVSYVPGVRVSGAISSFLFGGGDTSRGKLQVSGPAAARGVLTLRKGVLSGYLGGRRIRAPYATDIERFLFGVLATTKAVSR